MKRINRTVSDEEFEKILQLCVRLVNEAGHDDYGLSALSMAFISLAHFCGLEDDDIREWIDDQLEQCGRDIDHLVRSEKKDLPS